MRCSGKAAPLCPHVVKLTIPLCYVLVLFAGSDPVGLEFIIMRRVGAGQGHDNAFSN
jgi:hypothetical protein